MLSDSSDMLTFHESVKGEGHIVQPGEFQTFITRVDPAALTVDDRLALLDLLQAAEESRSVFGATA